MEPAPQREELPDVSGAQRASAELVKGIRKLRWIGLEEEAGRLQTALSCIPAANVALGEAQETD
jgi:hypothetical protein